MHYYQFNLGDYARDTQHLTEMEDLAYRRMLDLYYLKEKPLPRSVDQIARLIRMRSHTECIANVLQDFFFCEKDGYHNSGADKVLSRVQSKSAKAKEAALKRWSKNNNLEDANALPTESECTANGMQPKTQDPIPKTHIKEDSDKQGLPPCPQQEILKAWKEVMPDKTQPRTWDGQRAQNLKARWNAGFRIERNDGKGFLYTDSESGINFWKAFFAFMRKSPFLMNECRPFGLDWIVKKANFEKILEHKYHG